MRGSGDRLCRFGEEPLRGRGASTLVIWVFAGNAIARRFYEAMGHAPDDASKILDFGAPLEALQFRRAFPTASA